MLSTNMNYFHLANSRDANGISYFDGHLQDVATAVILWDSRSVLSFVLFLSLHPDTAWILV